MQTRALLEWYLQAGVDETTGDEARDCFSVQSSVAEVQSSGVSEQKSEAKPLNSELRPLITPLAATSAARTLADAAATLSDLEDAVRAFDGCALKRTASKTVFADGNAQAPLMIIGEAPGAEEDLQGIPFCGPSGKLLDKMLAAIGRDRARDVYITNTVFWRPPGNRTPSPEETAICLPLVEKHIALAAPKLLVLAGGVATTALLKQETAISRLRGRTYDYTNPYLTAPIPTLVTYHPSYLLRTPAQKKLAWEDWLRVKGFLI